MQVPGRHFAKDDSAESIHSQSGAPRTASKASQPQQPGGLPPQPDPALDASRGSTASGASGASDPTSPASARSFPRAGQGPQYASALLAAQPAAAAAQPQLLAAHPAALAAAAPGGYLPGVAGSPLHLLQTAAPLTPQLAPAAPRSRGSFDSLGSFSSGGPPSSRASLDGVGPSAAAAAHHLASQLATIGEAASATAFSPQQQLAALQIAAGINPTASAMASPALAGMAGLPAAAQQVSQSAATALAAQQQLAAVSLGLAVAQQQQQQQQQQQAQALAQAQAQAQAQQEQARQEGGFGSPMASIVPLPTSFAPVTSAARQMASPLGSVQSGASQPVGAAAGQAWPDAAAGTALGLGYLAPAQSSRLPSGASALSVPSGMTQPGSAPTAASSALSAKTAVSSAVEAAQTASAVVAQQTATAQQAAATYSAATGEAAAAQQVASALTATAQQAVAEQRADVAQLAAQQAMQAEQQAAAMTAVASEAAQLYQDATQKASEASRQVEVARAEAAAAVVATLAGGLPQESSSAASLPPLASPAGTTAGQLPPALATTAPSAPTEQQRSSGATASQPELPSRSSTFHSDAANLPPGAGISPAMSLEQAQQQLVMLQAYLAQQAQQAQQGLQVQGPPALSPPALTPQPSALSHISSVSLEGSGPHLWAPTAPLVANGMPAAMAAVPVVLTGATAMPASAPLAAHIAAGALVPPQVASAQQLHLSPPAVGNMGSGAAGALQQQQQHQQAQGMAIPNTLHFRLPTAQQSQLIKVVCSSGGSFIKLSTGTWEYEGGETRLVGIPLGCTWQALLDAMERITVTESSSRDLLPMIKYRLPSDPNVWVDVMDDDDVQLMFDEWVEFCGGARTSAKLHVFVQWRAASGSGHPEEEGETPRSQAAGGETPRSEHGGQREEEGEGAEFGHRHRQQLGGGSSDESSSDSDSVGSPRGSHGRGEKRHGGKWQDQVSRLRPSIDLASIVEKMEIIDAAHITLVRFLGSGGYGDVYLAKWHNCEVAVKCLNPSLFFNGGDLSSVNRAAIVDLVKEADMLGSLRHPNIVWVYGIVLPNLADTKGWKKRNRDLAEIIVQAGSGPALPAVPGLLRPPALVAEYMGGGSLKSALGRKADIVAGALTRVVLALDAAKGMEYLHAKSIVHFDLKSGNLLLGYRDRRPVCKVADFGLSKTKIETFVSGVTSQRGTLPWTAPEIVRTPDKVNEKVDCYSFGIVLWELWTGREPFEGLNYHALLLQLSNPNIRLRPPIPGTPEWDGEDMPELAPGWRALMERCWEEDPADRPSFSDIIRELRRMVSALKPARSGSKNLPRSPSH